MFTQPPEFLDVQPLNFCMAQRRERARTDAGRNNIKLAMAQNEKSKEGKSKYRISGIWECRSGVGCRFIATNESEFKT